MKLHKTREGNLIKLCDLSDNHLNNIINLIKKRAKKGVTLKYGGGENDDSMYYDEEELSYENSLLFLDYFAYKKELIKRKIKNENIDTEQNLTGRYNGTVFSR
jgi:hypothetical protein